ncbi:MAG TPA: glycosyltransferase, partial [Thermoanaerobaculia bacterium]
PEVTWEVVGEGSLRGELEGEIDRRGLAGAVRLAGALPEDEVARRLARADLFVLPSVVAPDGQMEGIPVALMEAMAAGRPVVASRLSGIPELVADGETGLLVPPGDAGAVAAAVARLLEEPGLGARLGEAGRRRVAEEFRLAATVAELLALLDRETGGWSLHPEIEGPVRELLDRAGLAGRPAGVRRVHEGPDSRVAELLVGAGGDGGPPRELVAKVHRSRSGESAPPEERARREHEVLARLAAAGRGGPYGVPRPVVLAESSGALLLERARGVPLDRLIRELRLFPGGRARARLADAFRRAGAWLRWFRGEMGEGVRHGDFWPGNVYVSDDRVEAIDLEGCGTLPPGAPPEDDAAWFLRHARLYFRLPGLGRRFRPLERAFLDGLGGGAP